MSAERRYRIALLPGDGIGHEVVGAARQVLEGLAGATSGLGFELVEAQVGTTALKAEGESFSDRTLELARSADAVLHGASDVAALPVGAASPLRGLRRGLDAYANVRPSRAYPGVAAVNPDVDLVVVRENTEGLYSGIEYRATADVACAVRVISREGSARVARKAFELARTRRKLVTAVHKLGGLPITDGLWLESIRGVAAAYPDVRLETRNVDAAALEMIRHPSAFDVILAENQYGDILSDVGAAMAGGLGLAPSGSFGDRWAYFEPVHGTAPDIAGRGIANPIATFLATRMLLEHLGERDAAERLEAAIRGSLGDPATRTPDLGGTGRTADVTRAVIERLAPSCRPELPLSS